MIELLTTNHFERILDLFDGAHHEIKIASPFLTMSMAEKLCNVVKEKGMQCTFITRLYIEDMLSKANSIDALAHLLNNDIKVLLVKKLHTKLYLFDDEQAILGSANFTNGGFKSNIELSLLLSEESVVKELQTYFDKMAVQIEGAEGGLLTENTIENAREKYAFAYSSKKHEGTGTSWNATMYGAYLSKNDELKNTDSVIRELQECKNEKKDVVIELFKYSEKTEQVKYPYTIWLKFDGEGNDRLRADEPFPMTDVKLNGNIAYLSNYPFKVWSIKDNDEAYFAALTTDKCGKNQPVIVGRGRLQGFTDANHVNDEMLSAYDWMDRYPWYCVIKECEILDTTVDNGIPMDTVWAALGSDTYEASFGKDEDIAAVGRKHYQKAHIRLSGNAKQFIDTKFEQLKLKYGVKCYASNI